VDSRGESREFLASRRAKITPARVGVGTWATHNVRLHRTGITCFHHPDVGDLELTFTAMDLPSQPGLTLKAYTADAGSPSEDGLSLLASWAATTTEPASTP